MKFMFSILLSLVTTALLAGPGHDHGHDDQPKVVNPNAPARQPDGSVFLPKHSQRFIRVRTQLVKQESLPRSLILYGRIVTGSNASSKVQALQSGRLNLINGALPAVGDRVKKGQLLATISLAKDAQEGTNQAAELAELAEQLKLAQLEQERLEKVGSLIPRRDLDAAVAKVRGLKARIGILRQGAAGSTEQVRSPISGIVTQSLAANGQAVQAGDSLLQLIDPSKLQVEAVTYDPMLPTRITGASMKVSGQRFNLGYQGVMPQLRQQALPLRFAIKSGMQNQSASLSDSGLVSGLPVQIRVQTKETLKGIALPSNALVRNASNQTVVWVKTSVESYQPRVISYLPLDAERIVVNAGLKDGDRVVTQSVNLINQIR